MDCCTDFAVFVALTLAISFSFAGKTNSSQGYFAAHGEVHWIVNGVAFAGDYLSAASFLGICGMIAFLVTMVFYIPLVILQDGLLHYL